MRGSAAGGCHRGEYTFTPFLKQAFVPRAYQYPPQIQHPGVFCLCGTTVVRTAWATTVWVAFGVGVGVALGVGVAVAVGVGVIVGVGEG